MGTEFDCEFTFQVNPVRDKVTIVIGPVGTAEVKELIDWMDSEEGRERIAHNIARALLGDVDV